jgi:hypothetical protein
MVQATVVNPTPPFLEVDTELCSVQRTLAPIGEKWIVLIARDAANGVSRFDDFRRHIGMSDAVLSDAILSHLEASGRRPPAGKRSPATPRSRTDDSRVRLGTMRRHRVGQVLRGHTAAQHR